MYFGPEEGSFLVGFSLGQSLLIMFQAVYYEVDLIHNWNFVHVLRIPYLTN
jgi:hypothetical protein